MKNYKIIDEKQRFKNIGKNFSNLRFHLEKIYIGTMTLERMSNLIKEKSGVVIAPSKLSRLENGKSEPSKNDLIALKQFAPFVTTDFLLGYTTNMCATVEDNTICEKLGLSTTAIQILKNMKEDTFCNHKTLEKFLNYTNCYILQAMLKDIEEFEKLSKTPIYKAETGEKLEKAKELYEKRTGKPLDNYKNEEFIMVDLNNLTTKQNKIIEKLQFTKFKISNNFNKMLLNIVKKNF